MTLQNCNNNRTIQPNCRLKKMVSKKLPMNNATSSWHMNDYPVRLYNCPIIMKMNSTLFCTMSGADEHTPMLSSRACEAACGDLRKRREAALGRIKRRFLSYLKVRGDSSWRRASAVYYTHTQARASRTLVLVRQVVDRHVQLPVEPVELDTYQASRLIRQMRKSSPSSDQLLCRPICRLSSPSNSTSK